MSFSNMLFYFLLGILQGIFEWLPISSEGIVSLAGSLFLKNFNIVDFSLFLHLGTFFACIFYFWRDLKNVLLFKNKELFRFLLISTIFSLAVAFPIYKLVRNIIFGNFLLIITGIGLLFTSYFNRKRVGLKINFDRLAILAGIFQGLAVIPGLSRSGATVFALSFSQLKPEEILKISYLMSIPVVFISSVYLYLENPRLLFEGWPAFISSFLVGFLSLKVLISLSKRMNFSKFALFFALLCFLGAILNFIF